MNLKNLTIFFLIMLFSFPLFANAEGNEADCERIKKRLVQYIAGYNYTTGNVIETDAEAIDQTLAGLSGDGSWKDIPYKDKQASKRKHWERIYQLSQATYLDDLSAEKTHACKDGITAAIDFWQQGHFSAKNWWYRDVHFPKIAGYVGLLTEDWLPERQNVYISDKILSKAKIGMMGQNKVWLSVNHFVHGLYTDQYKFCKASAEAINSEIRITNGQGIRPDYTFQMHQQQYQMTNYGKAFAGSISRWIWFTKDTQYAPTEKQLKIFYDYIFEAHQWNVWKDIYCFCAEGRQLSRNHPRVTATSLVEDIVPFMELSYPEQTDYISNFKDSYYKKTPNVNINGCRIFWNSDVMFYRDQSFIEVKCDSGRIRANESLNGENLLAHYTGLGMCLYYHSAREYLDIAPLWDWCKLPGTTVAQEPKAASRSANRNDRPGNDNMFVGGASDGSGGFIAMDYAFDKVRAKKAYFTYDNKIICLGAGISSSSEYEVVTGIEQSWAGNVAGKTKGTREQTASKGFEFDGTNLEYAKCNGMTYFPLADKQRVVAGMKHKQGDWGSVKSSRAGCLEEGDVFYMHLSHGIKPENAKYSYMVTCPGCQNTNQPDTIVNTKALQAIYDQGKMYAAFYEAGSFVYALGCKITVDKPCALVFDGINTVYASSPDRTTKSVNVRIKTPAKNLKATIKLPTGNLKGSINSPFCIQRFPILAADPDHSPGAAF